MESSHSPSNFPEEMTDLIFSNTDAKTAKALLRVNKKYSIDKDLWQKILPEGFPIPQGVNPRTYVLSHIIQNGENGILPRIRNFFLSLKMNENSKIQFAFIKPNATYEECFANPSVELGIKFKNITKETPLERYLFAKEFLPSCIIDNPSSTDLNNLSVNSSYFPQSGLPPFIMKMKERGQKLLMEYIKNNTNIDITLAETNPALFNKTLLNTGILSEISQYIEKNMPNDPLVKDKESKLTSDEYKTLTKLVTEEVLRLDTKLSIANLSDKAKKA